MTQLRQHLKFTWKHRLRAFKEGNRLGYIGKRVHIDKGVEFMRFPKNIQIDDEVILKEGARICACNKDAFIKIGKRTTIGYHTFIFSSSSIHIGDDCLIAPFVYLVDSNHQIERDILINKQPNVVSPIIISNDVWIASSVTILKGVKIGEGAIIAANSVVNNDIPPYEIWGGSPARKIGERE